MSLFSSGYYEILLQIAGAIFVFLLNYSTAYLIIKFRLILHRIKLASIVNAYAMVADVWLKFAFVHIFFTERPFITRRADTGEVGYTVSASGASRASVVDTVVHVIRAVGPSVPLRTPALVTVH